MIKHILFTLCLFAATITFAQSKKEKAHNLAVKAITEMEAGNTDYAIQLLEEAELLDPENYLFQYEIGYAHFIAKDYKKAIKVYKKLTSRNDINDQVYQMLGNIYDYDGKPKKAIKTYEEGLKRFPNSGKLHLERGNMEMFAKNYSTALWYFEEGIKREPTFPSNYYWASKLYCSSENEVWGMIYGEIFMNLERNSKRTVEISKMLYDVYKSEITLSSNEADSTSNIKVSFCKKNANVIYLSSDNFDDQINQIASNLESLLLGKPSESANWGLNIYETNLLFALVDTKEITIESLSKMRTNFIKLYFEKKNNEAYPNVLFNYHKQIIDSGYGEAYSHWILMQGNLDEFNKWESENKDKMDAFVEWFTDNPLKITNKSYFHRSNF